MTKHGKYHNKIHWFSNVSLTNKPFFKTISQARAPRKKRRSCLLVEVQMRALESKWTSLHPSRDPEAPLWRVPTRLHETLSRNLHRRQKTEESGDMGSSLSSASVCQTITVGFRILNCKISGKANRWPLGGHFPLAFSCAALSRILSQHVTLRSP